MQQIECNTEKVLYLPFRMEYKVAQYLKITLILSTTNDVNFMLLSQSARLNSFLMLSRLTKFLILNINNFKPLLIKSGM